MQIAAVMYLLSVGSEYNKLTQLMAACAPYNDPACTAEARARLSDWTQDIVLWLGLSLIALRGAALMQSLAKRLGAARRVRRAAWCRRPLRGLPAPLR